MSPGEGLNTMEENNKPANIWNEIAKRALRTGAHVPVVEEEFNHEKARDGLAWNFGHNRRQKQFVVSKFAQIIKDGSFALGSMLRIARDESGEWVLIDGQHRLSAIAESGMRVWMMVAIDERPAHIAYASIDNIGNTRTVVDSISSMLGWSTKRWTAVVSAANIIRSGFDRQTIWMGGNKIESINEKNEKIAATIEKYKKEILRLGDIRGDASKFRAPSICVYIVAAHYAPDVFWPFFESAISDDMLAKNSPEKKLNEVFQMNASSNDARLKCFFYTAMAWNAAYQRKELPVFGRVVMTGSLATPIPPILGTPFQG